MEAKPTAAFNLAIFASSAAAAAAAAAASACALACQPIDNVVRTPLAQWFQGTSLFTSAASLAAASSLAFNSACVCVTRPRVAIYSCIVGAFHRQRSTKSHLFDLLFGLRANKTLFPSLFDNSLQTTCRW